jgi:hypothetical protein
MLLSCTRGKVSTVCFCPFIAPSPPAPYYVLDTDYENWASVYSCSKSRPEGSSYVLARSTDIGVEMVSAV